LKQKKNTAKEGKRSYETLPLPWKFLVAIVKGIMKSDF